MAAFRPAEFIVLGITQLLRVLIFLSIKKPPVY
jgi:hypothetical protein